MRIRIANLVAYVHLILIGYVILGWAWPAPGNLLFHFILILVTLLQWQFNSGECLLTNLENYLRNGNWKLDAKKDQGDFTKRIFKRVLGRVPSDKFLLLFIYCIMFGSMLISFLRLYASAFK